MPKKRFQPEEVTGSSATPTSCSAGVYLEPAVAHHSPDLQPPKAIESCWGHPPCTNWRSEELSGWGDSDGRPIVRPRTRNRARHGY